MSQQPLAIFRFGAAVGRGTLIQCLQVLSWASGSRAVQQNRIDLEPYLLSMRSESALACLLPWWL